MRYKRPEMGYCKIGILHNSRVYVKETIVFWKRKGKEVSHCGRGKGFFIWERKGYRKVKRWRLYLMSQGMRKSMARHNIDKRIPPSANDPWVEVL